MDWWVEKHGRAPVIASKEKVIAPKVKKKAKRRAIISYGGKFLDLARALFCELDKFNDMEVVAAAQNVLKARRLDSDQS